MRKNEWQVIRLGARGEYIGTVTAPDEQSAIKAAIELFALQAEEAKRLLVRRLAHIAGRRLIDQALTKGEARRIAVNTLSCQNC